MMDYIKQNRKKFYEENKVLFSFNLESKVVEMCYNIYERDECYE